MILEDAESDEYAFDDLIHVLRQQSSQESTQLSPLDVDSLLKLLQDKRITSLLRIYNEMCQFSRELKHKPLETNSYQLSEEISSQLGSEWINEAQSLCQLLSNPHLKALLIANDVIAQQRYSPSLPPESEESYSVTQSTSDIEIDSIKIVQVIKNKEPLGATVSIDDNGYVNIARVLFGGAAHRSGLIQVGDQIYEVNGIVLRGLSPLDVISVLEKECRSYSISFKLIPGEYGGYNKVESKESRLRVRTHFDYAPYKDSYHPCPKAGISFKKGDILHVVNQDDANWWQARQEPSIFFNEYFYSTRAGIIPGKQLQERRFAALRDLKSMEDARRFVEILPGFKSPFKRSFLGTRKVKKIMYRISDNDEFDREEIATYDEVAKLYPKEGSYRPLVFIGPPGVGRNELIRHLIALDPEFYQRPIPHTTRPSKEYELDGREYFFVSKEWAENEAKIGNFVEFGTFRENFYGTHLDTIRAIINKGCVAILNPNPQSLKNIYTPELKPFVIFVKPPFDLQLLRKTRNERNARCTFPDLQCRHFTDKDFKEMIITAHRIETVYGHYFDYTLVNAHLEEAFEKLIYIVKLVEIEPLWAPASWS
ncbi:MAGUK p55 subfamily member 7-like protein [Dinothrombium tinctorium]|uniref:MAGUK p55 subfamily member 7-like protein n=1 Tax=Dinothrombium tinctorium TaxID=1965070 RepID=A0A3S3Q6B1_9ACAR|nr:MAGUK p55 subfamily member 7-like protein [Dinothrombium tinctorium]